jgi:hypothetical protein
VGRPPVLAHCFAQATPLLLRGRALQIDPPYLVVPARGIVLRELADAVERVTLLVVPRGRARLALAEVAFRGGGEARCYVVVLKPGAEPAAMSAVGLDWSFLRDPNAAAEFAEVAWERLASALGVAL